MTVKELKKVSINELISLANYSIEETIVPPYDKIVEEFSDTWADMYLDEDLKEQEGKHCFIVWDDCNYNIRAIVVAEELDDNAKIMLIEIMDNVIFDLLYDDIVEESVDEDSTCDLENGEDYCKLLQYIDSLDTLPISVYEYSWLQVLVNGRLDLVTL